MHLVAEVITNAEEVLVATNDWTMELISDHTWRGFVWTPTNYTDKVAHLKFVGKNLWETNAVRPSLDSNTWYFPPAATGDAEIEIPMGSIAVTNLGEAAERDITLDCSAGYLIFEFNDESGAFTMNRAEHQDFNQWTPEAGQEENRYIGNFVNTSYVGRAKQTYDLPLSSLTMSRSSSAYWWENFDQMAGNADYPFNMPFEEHVTPNGWMAGKGMFVNGMFSAVTNKDTFGMALQLEGRGNGSLSLIDPADIPQGIGTVSFTARLAQYLDFGDFFYYVDGTFKTNYAMSARIAMTHRTQRFSDVSMGTPSLSLVAYYRPGKGCYEFRITRISGTYNNLWDSNGQMELALYKWVMDEDTGEYEPQRLTATTVKSKDLYLVPAGSGTSEIDNTRWWSAYICAYNVSGSSTYVEAGVTKAANTSVYAYSDLNSSVGMNVVHATDSSNPFTKGTYGVCTRECPGTFGNIQFHVLTGGRTGTEYYKNPSSGAFASTIFRACPEGSETQEDSWRWIEHTMDDNDWGSASPRRIIPWTKNASTVYTGTYRYGLCAAPVSQKLYLKTSPIGDSTNWKDTGLDLTLTSYITNRVEFSPHTTTPANIQIKVGGKSKDVRTDVVVDDLQFSQWAGESSSTSDQGSLTKWAYTDAWIAGTTNDFYQVAGSKDDNIESDIASLTKCGYYVYKVPDTENDYIYVFTNTPSEVSFVPKADLTVKELFILGGGGGGGPGGGGGGGGEALWITNSVDYSAGETGIRLKVGTGGSGGTASYSNNNVQPSGGSGGVTSYVYLKNPFKTSEIQYYRGYGGYRGGWFYNHSTASTRNTNNAGGGASDGGGSGGGSALISAGHTAASMVTATSSPHYLQTYGHEIYGSGYGGAAVNGAPGGGGGGGLRGVGDNGNNYASGSTAANPRFVIYPGSDGENGTGEATGGKGGDGFPITVMGDSYIRTAIATLLNPENPAMDAWLGGGGGGGSGINTTQASITAFGVGAYGPGLGGNGGGGNGGLYTVSTDAYIGDTPGRMGKDAAPFTGGGGGGGSFNNPVTSGSQAANNWIRGGGKGADGLVVMHVQVKDRFVMLQPMRGSEMKPMSVRTPFMNGLSLIAFSWKWADSNAVLRVQISTNGVDETTVRSRTQSLTDNWIDVVNASTNYVAGGWVTNFNGVIKFSEMDAARRREGSTNILIGLRAPISGIVRVLSDPAVVATARRGSTNDLYSMYGTVLITGMKVLDEPELDDRSWWGWNIMPTYKLEWSSLYDPVTLGPGRSCGLNFSGVSGTGADDPLFADNPETANYAKHDPFIQTPRFTNSIGTVSFKARVLETNLTSSGWVTVSACTDPGEEDDAKWDVLTNIEITAGTTIFTPYSWRLPTSKSHYQALRLSTFGAAEGRNHSEETTPAQPFGDHGTANPVPVQRVLIDEVTVTQPMQPKVAFVNAYPFRMKLSDDSGDAIPTDVIVGPDAQPLLGEMFGFQTHLVPAGMEDELDVDSIRVYMAWYAGESPWGYENWKDLSGVVTGVELARAADWSAGNLVYRSASTNMAAFVPPQLPGENGYQIVQYHLWAEYKNKNGIEQDPHELSATDWKLPGWYRGIDDPNKLSGGAFSAYTVLDTISPKRAWFNEINMFDGNVSDFNHQYLEVAVPQGFDMTGWSMSCIKNDDTYNLYSLASFGADGVVSFKSANATNSYAFIALQSPKTKAAGSYPGVNDGTWKATAFEDGSVDVSSPYALRLVRPTGIIEHEVVFMSTNTSTSRVRYIYEGTNLLKNLQTRLPDSDWVYAGADFDGGSLGVYTNHGETTSCWTNSMRQTPGRVNLLADGTPQFIDPNYFDPPGGTNLWIYANIDGGSQHSLEMVIGTVTNTSAVIIVPQDPETGTFTTSIVYVVRKWFEMDSIVTNEYGKAGGTVAEAPGQRGVWTLDLRNLKMSDANSRKFEVTASTRNSSNIPDAAHGGISSEDPYYPAVIDWLQNFDEKPIHLAPFWTLSDEQVYWNSKPCILNLKEMYWFNIPPVTESDTDEWVLKGGMGSGAIPSVATNVTVNGLVTNIRVAVTMMITNTLWSAGDDDRAPHPPNMLRGLSPKETSYGYDESVPGSSWTSVTFKVTGALQNGKVNTIYRPLCWFTFGPDSFTNGFTRVIEVKDPFSKGSPGYSYEWYKHPGSPVFYRWRVDDDETNRPPVTVYQLNDENALLTPDE